MELYELLKEFIKPELLILVPVLYLVGGAIHKSKIKNELIPVILGVSSIILVAIYLVATVDIKGAKDIALLLFTSLTQGILLSGASVYIDQIFKQTKKLKKE